VRPAVLRVRRAGADHPDLERLAAQAATVQQFVDLLQTRVTTMDLVVLGSRLNDTGCTTC
jgi:hypothetical protein